MSANQIRTDGLKIRSGDNSRAQFLSFTGVLLAFVIITAGNSIAHAQRPAVVDQLLIDQWDRNSANRSYEFEPVLEEGNETSGKIALAWVVNRVNQFDYDQASSTVDKIVRSFPNLLDAWYSKAWLDIRGDNIDGGLVALQSYREHLDKAALEQDQKLIHIRRMARLSGFIDGPANEKATPATLQQTLDRLTNELNDAERNAFDEEYHAAMDKFTNLTDTKDQKTQQALTVALNEQKKELTSLKMESQNLQQRDVDLRNDAEKIRVATNSRIAELRNQSLPLEQAANSLDAQVLRVRTDLNRLQNDLFWYQDRAAHETDPHRKQHLLNRIASISFAISNVQADWFALRGELRIVLGQLDAIHGEIAQTEASGNQQLGQISHQLDLIDKQLKKNSAKTLRTSRPPRPKSSLVTSIKNRTRFIGTFDPYPAEALKQRILESFE